MSTPLGNTPRIQAIRDGIAAGRDLGIFGELIIVLDTVAGALMGLQQAAGALAARVGALEAVGHDVGLTAVATTAEVLADGVLDAPEPPTDGGVTFGAAVAATGEVGTSGTP